MIPPKSEPIIMASKSESKLSAPASDVWLRVGVAEDGIGKVVSGSADKKYAIVKGVACDGPADGPAKYMALPR